VNLSQKRHIDCLDVSLGMPKTWRAACRPKMPEPESTIIGRDVDYGRPREAHQDGANGNGTANSLHNGYSRQKSSLHAGKMRLEAESLTETLWASSAIVKKIQLCGARTLLRARHAPRPVRAAALRYLQHAFRSAGEVSMLLSCQIHNLVDYIK
jgi:hypothetical protein